MCVCVCARAQREYERHLLDMGNLVQLTLKESSQIWTKKW